MDAVAVDVYLALEGLGEFGKGGFIAGPGSGEKLEIVVGGWRCGAQGEFLLIEEVSGHGSADGPGHPPG